MIDTKLKKDELSYQHVEQMMAKMFEKINENRRKFSRLTEQRQIEILNNTLDEIKYLHTVTRHSLINIFLDQYEKSVKSSIEEIKNS